MVNRKSYAELSHHARATCFAVERRAQFEVIDQSVSLLLKRRWMRLLALHHLSRLSENPWIADTSTGNAHRMDSGMLHHCKDVSDFKDVAASENQAIGIARDKFGQEWPV